MGDFAFFDLILIIWFEGLDRPITGWRNCFPPLFLRKFMWFFRRTQSPPSSRKRCKIPPKLVLRKKEKLEPSVFVGSFVAVGPTCPRPREKRNILIRNGSGHLFLDFI